MDKNIRKYVLTGLMTALVFILTFIIKIPVPYTSGYIHLGDSMIYISVIVLGPFLGAFASGVGSMLSDILGGYAQYALPTLIIKSIMALCMGFILKSKTRKSTFLSVISAIVVWIAFSVGAILNLQYHISTEGTSSILEKAGVDLQTINNLPIWLIVGIAASVIILSATAWFISRKASHSIFGIKAIVGMTAAGMCMVIGYFITESFMYGVIASTFSIPMNMIQFFSGVLVAGLLAPSIKRAVINPVFPWQNE